MSGSVYWYISKLQMVTRLMLILSCSFMPAALAQAPATPVIVNEVRLAALDTDKPASGLVHSRQYMQIMAGTAGRLEWIAEPGSLIAQGEELARLDLKPLQLRLREQELQAQRARINRDYYQHEIQRLESLKAADYAAANELDQLRLNLALAGNDLKAAKNRIAQLQDDINRGTIRAPFTGVVSDQQRYAGEELSRTDVLARLSGTEQLELRAQLPLAWLSQLQPGTVISIQARDKELLGTVRRLIPAGDTSTQTFEARIELPKEAPLAMGELAHLRLPQKLAAAQLQVPRDALVLRREAAYVFRITEASTVEKIPVSVDRGHGDWIAIAGELAAGDQVVVRGAERLQADQAVQVLRNLAAEQAVNASS